MLGGVVTADVICSVSLAAGGMCSAIGTALTVSIAVLVGLVVALLLWTLREHEKYLVAILSVCCGFLGGVYVFAICAWSAGGEFSEIWIFFVVSVIAMLILLAVPFCGPSKHLYKDAGVDANVVRLYTLVVGSYLFMRSWTFFFPGLDFPSELELVYPEDEDKKDDSLFWVNFIIFLGSIALFSGVNYWKRKKINEDDYFNSQ